MQKQRYRGAFQGVKHTPYTASITLSAKQKVVIASSSRHPRTASLTFGIKVYCIIVWRFPKAVHQRCKDNEMVRSYGVVERVEKMLTQDEVERTEWLGCK